jgi:hypothetical protein
MKRTDSVSSLYSRRRLLSADADSNVVMVNADVSGSYGSSTTFGKWNPQFITACTCTASAPTSVYLNLPLYLRPLDICFHQHLNS